MQILATRTVEPVTLDVMMSMVKYYSQLEVILVSYASAAVVDCCLAYLVHAERVRVRYQVDEQARKAVACRKRQPMLLLC